MYHFGTRFLVEVHIVLDAEMSLRIAHDISERLQTNIESLPEVERAFVHCDYESTHRPEDEHKGDGFFKIKNKRMSWLGLEIIVVSTPFKLAPVIGVVQ